jgi:hypothetical protein
LVVKAGDWSTRHEITPSAMFEATLVAVQRFLASAGFAPMFGRRLAGLFRDQGLVDVGGEARSRMLTVVHPRWSSSRCPSSGCGPRWSRRLDQ